MADSTIKIAVLDDYQNIALKMADWSSIPAVRVSPKSVNLLG